MENYEQDFTVEKYLRSRSINPDEAITDDFFDETRKRRNQPPGQPKKKKKRSIWKIIRRTLLVIGIVLLAIGATQYQKIQDIAQVFDSTAFSATQSNQNDAKGILVIGTDLSSGEESLNGYADSITYFGLNTTKKQVASLPIYRDARVGVTCNNNQKDNINRITKKHNINCFAESTANMLDLPVDYYVSVTIDGVETIVDKIGGIDITPNETFSSEYGRDGKVHSFVKGQTQHMSGSTVVAYLRDRQHGNGEGRANRQLSAIQAVKNACNADLLKCYNDVLPSVNKMMRTNVPADKISMLSAIGNKSYESKSFSVIGGQNTQLSDGWTQIIDENDRKTKTDYIRTNIFS